MNISTIPGITIVYNRTNSPLTWLEAAADIARYQARR